MEEIGAAGADVALVGRGTPEQAKGFRVLSGWGGPIVVDAEGKAYAAAAMRRTSVLTMLRPKMLLAAMRAKKAGFRMGKVQGDPWQLGGTLVVAPGDRVLYAHRDGGPEDEAPLDDVLASLRAAS